MDEGELRLSLVDYITLSDDCGRGVVLLVDEAHHLPLRLLDEIRSLTNLTRDMQPAVRLVLAGSHVLEDRFASPKLESFSQRISARCYLEAFQRSETQAYIQSRLSAGGGRGSEVFPAEACQRVHQATDGVPRLINQVCDHVLLLAYAAGIRRIEPAHVEEAWADLQQLPTPWNAPAAAASGDSVIEFGGLDDAPSELPPIAGKIAASEETAPAAALHVQPTLVVEREDPESFEQLRHIQKLLADVQAEFAPATAIEPEAELVFEEPHPFAEPFEEEEVIADRYAVAAVAASPAPSRLAAEPAASGEFKSVAPAPTRRDEYVAAAAATAVAPAPACESRKEQPEAVTVQQAPTPDAPSTKSRPKLRWPEPLPARPDQTRVAGADGQPGVRREEVETIPPTVAAVAEESSARPTRSVVPPPRQEFGRLFARLRQGL